MVDVANSPEKWHVECSSSVEQQRTKMFVCFVKNSPLKLTTLELPFHQRSGQLKEKGLKQLPFSASHNREKLNKTKPNRLWHESLCCRPLCWLTVGGEVPGLNSPATSRTRAWERGFCSCPKCFEKTCQFFNGKCQRKEKLDITLVPTPSSATWRDYLNRALPHRPSVNTTADSTSCRATMDLFFFVVEFASLLWEVGDCELF